MENSSTNALSDHSSPPVRVPQDTQNPFSSGGLCEKESEETEEVIINKIKNVTKTIFVQKQFPHLVVSFQKVNMYNVRKYEL